MKRNNRSDTAGGTAPSGSPNKIRRSLQKTFKSFRKRGALVLIVFLIIFAALCSFHYIRNTQTASTILSLDYEEASKGLTPNRMRFNIFEIRSGEVMERLISYAGLEGKVTPDELSECVSVQATHDKNISGNVNYLSTSFVVRFTNIVSIDRISAEDMLSLLCKAYREYFVEHYGFNHSILSFDINDLKFNDGYLMAVDLLELKCGQLEKYVELRSRESKNYQDPDTLVPYLTNNWVDEVYLDVSPKADMPVDLINDLMRMGITIHTALTNLDDIESRHKNVEWICGHLTITTSLGYITGRDVLLKRLMDIIGGLLGSAITVILTIPIGLAIFISDPGPIFFSQTRIGENGKKGSRSTSSAVCIRMRKPARNSLRRPAVRKISSCSRWSMTRGSSDKGSFVTADGKRESADGSATSLLMNFLSFSMS